MINAFLKEHLTLTHFKHLASDHYVLICSLNLPVLVFPMAGLSLTVQIGPFFRQSMTDWANQQDHTPKDLNLLDKNFKQAITTAANVSLPLSRPTIHSHKDIFFLWWESPRIKTDSSSPEKSCTRRPIDCVQVWTLGRCSFWRQSWVGMFLGEV